MNNLQRKALGIISQGGNLKKEMKVTDSKLNEVLAGIKKAGLVNGVAEEKLSVTKKGMRGI